MKYVGRLVLVAQAALMAGWVSAGTLTLNGNNCGNTTAAVSISTNGDVSVSTDGTCVPGGGGGGTGPYTLQVNKGGTGAVGTITAAAGNEDGIDCGTNCSEPYAASTSVTLTATLPTGTDTFAWGGACSGSSTTCTVNMTAARTVSATYNAAGSTPACPTGVTCIDRPWPVLAQEMFTMKANAVLAVKINTTAQGVGGYLNTMYTTGNTASRSVSLSTTPGDFTGGGQTRCVKSGLEVTSTDWQQQGTNTRACQLPVNSTAWINIKFTNCTATSCSFFLKNN